MLRRLQSAGLNLFVLGTSAAMFIIAFLLLQAYASARIPQSTRILAAARDIQIGDALDRGDFTIRTIFVDEFTEQYVSADDADTITGAFAALPIPAGQPIPRTNLVSPALPTERFSALLAQFPGHSLFPLPLDAANVVAPPVELVQPGDLVGVTVVIRSRPPQQATPTPDAFAYTLPGPAPTELPPLLPPATEKADESADRGFPPLAKDLFPGGVRVLGVLGLPQPAGPDDEPAAFNAYRQAEMLVLLLPNEGREPLSLALHQGDRVFVSLLNINASGEPTLGFTYWDLEAWFLEDRTSNPGR